MKFCKSTLLNCACLLAIAISAAKGGICRKKSLNRRSAIRFLLNNDARALYYEKQAYYYMWDYEIDLSEANEEAFLKFKEKKAKFELTEWKKVKECFDWEAFKHTDPLIYRRFKLMSELGTSVLPIKEYEEDTQIIQDMVRIFSTAKICEHDNDCDTPTLEMEPEINKIMATSTDYDELLRVWASWRNATGKNMRKLFFRYIELENKAARINGFQDNGKLWLANFEVDDFPQQVAKIWSHLEPFYKQLHAYVRKKLMLAFPGKIKSDGPIPAHLLGSIMPHYWSDIDRIVTPYPNVTQMDVTQTMKEKGMTPLEMVQMSEEFYTSLGLLPMTPEFWNNSIFEKLKGKNMVCHASAWDFYDGKDMRIKMCTQVNMQDLGVIHHEMGHVQYFLQYRKQPCVFRMGANEGFHESIGDTIALSVMTPQHLKKVGLLKDFEENEEQEINFLMRMSLDRIAFIPFAYVVDLWRWKLFSGDIREEEANTEWWKMRKKYQGLCPAIRRTEENLDPTALFHVSSDYSYIRYFVARILQFQFHRVLCKESGHRGPLHKCDIYRSKKAGRLFSRMLRKGRSVTWNEALAIITKGETDQMDVTGILEYFDPLIKWLEKENQGEFIGWRSDDATLCP